MRAHQQTLLLNADYRPIKAISWERAVVLLFEERADLVVGYLGKMLHTVSTAIEWPAVVRLRKFRDVRVRIRFNRQNVLARDNYTCAYCGASPTTSGGKPDLGALTIDHVAPRAHSKHGKVFSPVFKREVTITCWENVVAACTDCNIRKADRTPAQAGMPLRFLPRVPSPVDLLRMHLRRVTIPEEWKTYLPAGAEGWQYYWTGELDPG